MLDYRLKRRVRRRLPRPVSRKNNINSAVPLKVLKFPSFTGIVVGHWLSKLGGLKPAFSVLPPAKRKS